MADYKNLIIPQSYNDYVTKAAGLTETTERKASDSDLQEQISSNATNIATNKENITSNTKNISALIASKATANGLATLGSDGFLLSTQWFLSHNIPRLTPKDITSYYTDGSLWNRLAGTNGYSLYEDIYVGDYFKMTNGAISAYEQTQTYQTTGSQYVTIAGISTLKGNGDNISMSYEHLVMVPGQGFGGTQHFGRSRMNSSNTTSGGYVGSEMFTTTLGAVATSGSRDTGASINQQLYYEFGSHLKTTRELLSNSINSSGYNRWGTNSGCSNNWAWASCQAVLMSEIECYGSTVWSSSGYDTGNANHQLPLFFFNNYARNNRSAYYWLKDVASGAYFCYANLGGYSSCGVASNAGSCVRPRFVIA